jgi:hypothetical protein
MDVNEVALPRALPFGHSGPVPNLDFYAMGADHATVLDAVFGLGMLRVFEAYSAPEEELREFTAPGEVLAAGVQRFLMLYVVGSGPRTYAPGSATLWRTRPNGCGRSPGPAATARWPRCGWIPAGSRGSRTWARAADRC